jgi:hypothetical protein
MDISFISLIVFTILTIVYFAFPSTADFPVTKPALTIDAYVTPGVMQSWYSSYTISLGIFVLVTLCSQFILNVAYLGSKCGSNPANTFSAFKYTFVPWLFIFGVLIATLFIFPGFKSAFSDVIGYFVVAGKANDIFAELLVNTDANTPELAQAAESIVKICGNKSVLINKINIENFGDLWNILNPLKKPEFQMVNGIDPESVVSLKQALLDTVLLKDNIGEALWYIYSAILITSIVYYNLAVKGCVQDISQIKQQHDDYIKQQEADAKKAEINSQVKYTNQ